MILEETLKKALQAHSGLRLALLFGSCALGKERPDSDVDVAVDMGGVMAAEQHVSLISDLALATGRAVDLIDLRTVGEPLLGQILQSGRRIGGEHAVHAQYITRHVMDVEDFVPYQERILRERRQAWIG
jgi:predicted nucleotidyltransferase